MRDEKSLLNMIKTAFVPVVIYYFVHQISATVLLSVLSEISAGSMEIRGGIFTLLAKMLAMVLGGAAVCSYYVKEKLIRKTDNKCNIESKFNIYERVGIIVAGAVFSLVINYIFTVAGWLESSETYSKVADEQFSYALIPALFFYGIVSPIVEEMVFRGIVYNSLRRNLGVFSAIIGSALLFGAIHGNIVQMVYGTIMGIFMAFFYKKYDKLLAPVLFHGGANVAVYLYVSLFS